MKIKYLAIASALLLTTSAFANVGGDDNKVQFIINNKASGMFAVVGPQVFVQPFFPDEFNVVLNPDGTIATFLPDQNGPYPGHVITYGTLGIVVWQSNTGSKICKATASAMLFAGDGKHPTGVMFDSNRPSVETYSSQYTCAAYETDQNTVQIDVVSVPPKH